MGRSSDQQWRLLTVTFKVVRDLRACGVIDSATQFAGLRFQGETGTGSIARRAWLRAAKKALLHPGHWPKRHPALPVHPADDAALLAWRIDPPPGRLSLPRNRQN